MAMTHHARIGGVDDALVAVTGLKEALLEHIDLYHWSLPVGNPDVLALRDYSLGVVSAAASDLEQAWIAFSLYARVRTAQSGRYADNERVTGNPLTPGDIRSRIDELSTEGRVHRLATVVSLAAAMDCLAGSAAAILGVGIDVMRADLGQLFQRPGFTVQPSILRKLGGEEPWNDVQRRSLENLAECIRAAGPLGWADWLVAQRNTLVHRELPTDVIQVDRERGRMVWRTVLMQSPQYSNIQALQATPEALAELVLTEDSVTTLRGAVESTASVLAEGSAVLRRAWEQRRRIRPSIPWELQWKPPGSKSEFGGYSPGEIDFSKSDAVMMGPEQLRRLREADVISPY